MYLFFFLLFISLQISTRKNRRGKVYIPIVNDIEIYIKIYRIYVYENQDIFYKYCYLAKSS